MEWRKYAVRRRGKYTKNPNDRGRGEPEGALLWLKWEKGS